MRSQRLSSSRDTGIGSQRSLRYGTGATDAQDYKLAFHENRSIWMILTKLRNFWGLVRKQTKVLQLRKKKNRL